MGGREDGETQLGFWGRSTRRLGNAKGVETKNGKKNGGLVRERKEFEGGEGQSGKYGREGGPQHGLAAREREKLEERRPEKRSGRRAVGRAVWERTGTAGAAVRATQCCVHQSPGPRTGCCGLRLSMGERGPGEGGALLLWSRALLRPGLLPTERDGEGMCGHGPIKTRLCLAEPCYCAIGLARGN